MVMTDEPTTRMRRAYGSGLRTTLRDNSAAYGYSVSLTATFGITSTQHAQHAGAIQVLLFAAGAAMAFLLVEGVASRMFQRSGRSEQPLTSMVTGALDVLSILAAVGAGIGFAYVPGLAGWAAAAFAATTTYLLVGGLDVLMARYLANR